MAFFKVYLTDKVLWYFDVKHCSEFCLLKNYTTLFNVKISYEFFNETHKKPVYFDATLNFRASAPFIFKMLVNCTA